MIEKIPFIRNPLTIIAGFAGIAEVAGTTALALVDKELQNVFIWFVMGFPVFLVFCFFLTLNFNAKALYAPSDFQDEQNFLAMLSRNNEIQQGVEMAQKIVDQIALTTKASEPTNSVKMNQLGTDIVKLKAELSKIKRSAEDAVSERQKAVLIWQSSLILETISSSKEPMTIAKIASETDLDLKTTNELINYLIGKGFISPVHFGEGVAFSLSEPPASMVGHAVGSMHQQPKSSSEK